MYIGKDIRLSLFDNVKIDDIEFYIYEILVLYRVYMVIIII